MIQGRIRFMVSLAIVASFSSAFAGNEDEAVPGEFIVKLKSTAGFLSASSKLTFGAEDIRTVNASEKVYVIKRNILERTEFALLALENNSNVEYVEPNYILRINRLPNDPKFTELWGLKNTAQKSGKAGVDIGAEQAWDIQTGSKDVVVAVIDTGVDYTHEDLKENAWINTAEANGTTGVDDDKNGYVDDIHGYDFANNDGDPMDDHSHGSHCAGTIGAKGDDAKGVVGVNWDVRIMGIKFLTGSGSGTLENAVKAIDYATANKVNIMSNSWGGGGYMQSLFDAITRAQKQGILFVAAAGNNGTDNDTTASYPANYAIDNVLSVAAIDNQGNLAYFSNYGKKLVHVAAPGVNVLSSIPGGHKEYSGTSMATPHVAGAAALLLANESNLTYLELKERLIKTVQPISSLRNKVLSGGLINVYSALINQVAPPDLNDPINWQTLEKLVESAHPYASKSNVEFEVVIPGVSEISLYFDKFDTEKGYDTVEFIDAEGKSVAKWSGKHDGEFSPVVKGDRLKLRLTSDDSVNGFGFKISKVAFR